MVRHLRSLLFAALALSAVALLTVDTQAAAPNAPGTVTITPTSVKAGSTGNNFSFKYTAPAAQAVGGSVSFNIPAKWSKPQESTATAPGFVAIQKGSCSKASVGPVATNPDKSWTVTGAVTCAGGKSFNLTYAKVTAPRQAGAYQFTTKAKFKPTTSFLTFANEPSVSIKPGPAAAIAFGIQPSTTAVHALIAPAPTVRVLDAYGNQTNGTASVTIALGANPAGGTLTGTKTVVALAGIATFSDLSIDNVGNGYKIAAGSGLAGATSLGFNLTPAALAYLVLSPSLATISAGGSQSYTAEGFDSYSNSRGGVTAATTFSTSPDGSCSGATCTATKSGNHTVVASNGPATATSPLQVIPGPDAGLTFGIQPTNVGHGRVVSPGPTVRVVDAYGNVTGSTASVTMAISSNPSAGTLSGTTTVAASAGLATFAYLSIDNAGSSYTLSASSSGLTGTTSSNFNVLRATWSATGSLPVGRQGYTVTLLSNGKVLAAGGDGSGGRSSADLYDPVTETWSATGSMTTQYSDPSATLLPNGKVLVVSPSTKNAELYDPAAGTWSTTGSLVVAGYYYGNTSTLLSNGKVLLTGGGITQLYDIATGTWSLTGNNTGDSVWGTETITLLPNGKVLRAGVAFVGRFADAWASPSAELYDPASGTWSGTGSMTVARAYHTAALLSNGMVLVAGGLTDDIGCCSSPLSSAELYDPATGTWSSTGNLASAVGYGGASLTVLQNGQVLSLPTFELYDPISGTWSKTVSGGGGGHPILLQNGKVLLAESAQLFDPAY